MQNIFWTGLTNDERHLAITNVQNVINHYGDVIDFKLFSDISISIKIEIPEFQIAKLFNDLKTAIRLDDFDLSNLNSQKERTIFLNITFGSGTGNLKIEVPSVPG